MHRNEETIEKTVLRDTFQTERSVENYNYFCHFT